MAIKSLTITEDAYDTLKRLKHGDESFSEVILRVGLASAVTAKDLFGVLRMSEQEAAGTIGRINLNRKNIDRESRRRQNELKRIK